MSAVAEIPLRDRDGVVRARAVVDASDEPALARYRWSLDGDGYAMRTYRLPDGRSTTLRMGRVLVGLERGDPRQCDHVNRDKLDNRRCNLRVCSPLQNSQNRPSVSGSSSRYRGVTWVKRRGKWQAAAEVRGRTYFLGYFDDEDEAGAAAAEFRANHMPFSDEAAA